MSVTRWYVLSVTTNIQFPDRHSLWILQHFVFRTKIHIATTDSNIFPEFSLDTSVVRRSLFRRVMSVTQLFDFFSRRRMNILLLHNLTLLALSNLTETYIWFIKCMLTEN